MKKLNLIKRLWTDSHEKQSPQRFGRYAVMLLMLLTLGVGQAWAWGHKTKGGSWSDCGSTGFSHKTMKSGKTFDVWIATSPGGGVNITQNDGCNGQTFYASWTSKTGDIFRGTARWNNGLYCEESVVLPQGKVYLKIGSGSKQAMTSAGSYTYTIIVNFAAASTAYTIVGDDVSGATMENQNSMPAAGKPSSLTMSNSYTSSRAGWTKVTFDLYTNKVTEEALRNYDTANEYVYITNFSPWSNTTYWLLSNSYAYAQMDGGSAGKKNYQFTLVEGTAGANGAVYGAPVGTTGTYKTIVFTRNSATTSGDPTTTNCWNKSGAITIDATKNRATSWSVDGTSATWSMYAPPLSAITLADNSTTTYGGDGSSDTPYLVEKGTSINLQATGATKKVNDAKATINYQFLSGSSSVQDGTTSTYSFTASASAGTNYTMTLKGYTKVGTTSSTKKDASQTLYYRTVTCYTVTYNDNGATSGSIPAVSGSKYVSGSNVTLATNTGSLDKSGYSFNGWNTAPGGGGTHYDAGGTLEGISGNVTLYAEWSATPSLTVTAGTHVGTVTGSNPAVTLGNSYAISASNFDAGYEFNNWTASPAGNASFASSTSASTNVTVSNGSVTVTANAREKMTTVTINANPAGAGTFTVDASAFTEGNTTTAGVATSRTVVATPTSGKVFHDWTVTGNATGSASTNTYTLEGNGNAGTGTLTANFGIASGWYMEGTDFGGWNRGTAAYQLTYSYREMDGVVYYPTTLTKDHYWKVNNGTTPYSINSTSSPAIVKGTIYPIAEEWSYSTYASSTMNNVWVVVDKGTNKKLWVQDPQTFHNVNVTGADNAKGPVKVTLKTTSAFTKGDNVFETTQFANGETFTITVTPVTGYIPTITIGGNTPVTWWKEQATYTADGTMSTSDITVTISYTPTRAVTFAKTTGCNSLSATGPSSTAVTTGTKVKDGIVIRFAQTNSTGYTFSKWYSNTTGTDGTQYSASSSAYDLTISSTAYTIYPLYTENMTTVNLVASPAGKGTFSCGGNTVTSVSAGVTTHPVVTAVAGSGYRVNTSATVWSESSDYISLSSTSTNPTTITATGTSGNSATLTATFTPNPYTITLKKHNGDDDGSVSVTYDATTNLTSAVTPPTRTGYTFGGYYTGEGGSGTQLIEDDGDWIVDNAYIHEDGYWINAGSVTLHAKWTAIDYTVELDIDEDNHGTIDGKDTEASVTFDAAPTSIASGKLPTAANGYALDGYYTDHDGEGVKVINADGTWISNVTGYMSSGNWVYADDVTLYAYYKKAEITNLVAEPGVIAPGETITITPTIEPTPTGTTKVCYEVQYSNGTPLPSQPTFTPGVGNAVSFPVPSASATYIIQATLAKGSSCPADPGDVLSTRTTTFQVAGEHTVTIRYQDSDGRTLQASASIEARPLTWTTAGDITPPTITGYKFDHWDAGDGVTIKNGESDPVTTTTTSSIQIQAVYDGTLTAVYNKKKMIFFNNTLGWSDVYVYFYNTNKYWSGDYGSGAMKGQGFGEGESEHPYWEEEHGHMTQIEGTNIWYFDYEGANISTRANVVFTEANQHDSRWFWKTKAARRSDHVASLQMFVPLTTKTETKNSTDYFSSGYWMNYPENTGYSLLIYNQKAKYGATKLYEIPFEFTEDYTMPMELTVDLEAGQTYGFEIKRADGTYYSTTTTITANTSNWGLYKDQTSYCGLQTTAAGDYTFSLFYDGEYRVGVTYPVAVNDYRIVYTDLATWSKTAHTASWNHPSRVITKNSSATEVKKDTVSFFWTYGSTPAIKYQTCTAVAAGSASWNAGTAINVSGFSSVLTKKGVYNFIFEQPAGGASISLVGVEPYTGNYYIRTDCAGSTKWANFRSLDHQMTYSDYTEEHSGYSHYYAHWVTSGTNVKFCIANDYSMCITDTLVEDKGTVIANITAEGNANAGRLNSGNASIRFMWDYKTNKVSRAYISGSTNVSDRFLVLEGDSKMYDKDGSALSISGLNPNEANLIDDQNFVYEREIQVNTKARAKLTAKYNSNIQYFKGTEGAFAEGTTIELLGGDAGGKHTMRIVYDFKTNRLVTAYVPSGTINDDIAINADLMILREHQGAGQQLLFEGEGALSEVHTVYGVMRFNRWTLNNKEKTGEHSPVGDPKSIYERSLYWISFPFNVNLSDVFGFGTYGVDWIIEYYDGAERATNGYWVDSDGFWKMVMPAQRANFTLEAGKGYVLAIDVDAMKDNNETFWANNIEQVELFFPSATNVENITQTTAHTIVPEHECTIDRRTDKSVNNINKDRTKADSHWNMIGIPSYANYGATLTSDEAGTQTIRWNSNPYTNDLPFLYEWNMTDDSYTVQSGTTYPFKAMHSYMVQYHGDLYWSLASATPTPSPIVARRAYAEKPQNAEFRLELQQNEKMVDQTFVNMKDAEEISAGFKFDEDLCKEFNAGKANIYTLIENYLPAAGNTLPMSEQTALVPVGVKTTAAGEYTFAMPDGTNGVSVVLIDNIAGTRTNLALSDYTVALGKGDLSDRFMLEIAPVKQMPTGIEAVSDQHSAVRKVMIDGVLYIVKDGKVFDAQGKRLQ